jgi:argininosuccinate lyase
MADTTRVSSTPVEELPADILRLAAAIHAIPEQYSRDLLPALERVVESTKRRRRILSMVQDALSQLRLDMKYLMFDVEATRRERDEFQARLEEFENNQ